MFLLRKLKTKVTFYAVQVFLSEIIEDSIKDILRVVMFRKGAKYLDSKFCLGRGKRVDGNQKFNLKGQNVFTYS